MIKHGKVIPLEEVGPLAKLQLMPIRRFITKGVADAKEAISLTVQPCDVRGAKRFNNQFCALGKMLSRSALKPKAVSVARGVTYVVVNGLAVRFVNNRTASSAVDMFDKDGLIFHRPVTFGVPGKYQHLGAPAHKRSGKPGKKRMRTKKVARIVRSVAGGAVLRK